MLMTEAEDTGIVRLRRNRDSNILFRKERNTVNTEDFIIEDNALVKYSGNGGYVIIPYNVTDIKNHAFSDCKSLTGVKIPDGVVSIGAFAFYDCTGLTEVAIPDSVTSIGKAAFAYCENLTKIRLPDGMEIIEDWLFSGCINLKTVSLPSNAVRIGEEVFYGCRSLSSIVIPAGVESIGRRAFNWCFRLAEITLPERLVSSEALAMGYGELDEYIEGYGDDEQYWRDNMKEPTEHVIRSLDQRDWDCLFRHLDEKSLLWKSRLRSCLSDPENPNQRSLLGLLQT